MAKRPSSSAIAIQGTAWQTFLTSQAVTIRMMNDAATLAELAQELTAVARAGEPVALDFETVGGLTAGAIRPRLVQLFAGADEVAVADLDVTGFAPIACLADVGCIAYGAGFEARVFLAHGLEPQLNDAALAAGLRLDRDDFQRDLATTWRRIFKRPVPTNKKAMQTSDFTGELTAEQVAYAASDAVMAFQVWEKCQAEVRARSYEIARNAIISVAGMEMAGLGYDREAHAVMQAEWNKRAKLQAERFHEMTGLTTKNQKLFRDRLEKRTKSDLLNSWPRTASGLLSFSSKALANRPHAELPEVAQYLRSKKLGTLISTFGVKLMTKVSPMTGRIHFGFQLAGARTGRMTSSPNGQNLPSGPFRKIFRAPPGFKVVSIDYSAIELRAAALLAGEGSLLDVFRNPPRLPDRSRNPEGDPHEALTRTLKLDPALNAGHRLAKILNFRLLYGTGVNGFASTANMPVNDARDLIDRWQKARPWLVLWQRRIAHKTQRENHVVSTPVGRRVNCKLVDEDSNVAFLRNRCLNVPIQGGCAEALTVALPLARAGLQKIARPARLIAAVHDELVFECRDEDVEAASAAVAQAMAEGFKAVFGSMNRFADAARYAVGTPKVGQTWEGDVFDLAALSPDEHAILVKGLEIDEDDEEADTEAEEAKAALEDAAESDGVDLDFLRHEIRTISLPLLRNVGPKRLRLAFRSAGVELLAKADATALSDLQDRLAGDLPVDNMPDHCRLGPSSAGRWLNCPGSIAAVEAAPSYSTVDAHEGRKAHRRCGTVCSGV